MSTQVIGSVNEIEGAVSIMRDGESKALLTGDSILAGDVITASDSGRASIILSNSYGEPIGNLLVAPTGSVIADTTMKNGQTAFAFEALSDDGVTIANLDPDFAEMVELQGVEQVDAEGGMFGLFGGGLLAGGSLGGSAAAVGAGAVGLGLVASGGSDEGTSPTGSSGGSVDNSDGGNGDGGSGDGDGTGGGDTGGTTGTPLDMALDPAFDGLADTPLVAVSEPLEEGLTTLAQAVGGGEEEGGDTGGGDTGGTTGTPLDAAFDPLMEMAADSPLAPITSMLDPATVTDALGGALPV
ncbi:hypothetical protein [Limnobacter sp.]|uniref:hypothetical protein n=1 Tax=Limnobacter sp. TaxID=2003368 RepID=UPI002FE0F345